jgi:hypothetical protein
MPRDPRRPGGIDEVQDGVGATVGPDILKSHSRPKVSNDNPYSEAQFKKLKYCPAFPVSFGSLQNARAFCRAFFTYYNHEHRHSGIGLHTPYSVHIGTALAIQDKRQAVRTGATMGRWLVRTAGPRCS